MDYNYAQFGTRVISEFDRRQSGLVTFSKRLEEAKALGHPKFETLAVGEKGTATIATVFLDLSQFTRRTFWDSSDQVADLADAIMTGFIDAVTQFGGFALGLRGDGLFAGFGPGEPEVDVAHALAACAFSLRGVQDEVNPPLIERGIHPVQARAGVDYGEVTFVRSGNPDSSEVNVIGFAANFAAKCEKTADAWEVVVGQGAVNVVGDDLCDHHEDSPKEFTRDAERRYYRFYNYRWTSILPTLPGVLSELAGHPTTSVRLGH